MIKERPILFSTPMVQAILDGRKTQTRRTKGLEDVPLQKFDEIEYMPDHWGKRPWVFSHKIQSNPDRFEIKAGVKSIYGKPGDLLWVRETHRYCQPYGPESLRYEFKDGTYSDIDIEDFYKINDYNRWKPSIHMPKAAARIWLEITDISVERLQDISEEDAIAEGIEPVADGYKNYMPKLSSTSQFCWPTAYHSFQSLWESINGAKSWDLNPWLWVIKFKVLSTTSHPHTPNP